MWRHWIHHLLTNWKWTYTGLLYLQIHRQEWHTQLCAPSVCSNVFKPVFQKWKEIFLHGIITGAGKKITFSAKNLLHNMNNMVKWSFCKPFRAPIRKLYFLRGKSFITVCLGGICSSGLRQTTKKKDRRSKGETKPKSEIENTNINHQWIMQKILQCMDARHRPFLSFVKTNGAGGGGGVGDHHIHYIINGVASPPIEEHWNDYSWHWKMKMKRLPTKGHGRYSPFLSFLGFSGFTYFFTTIWLGGTCPVPLCHHIFLPRSVRRAWVTR